MWFLIALAANVLWSMGNFIDKILTVRFVHGPGTALILTLYTCLLSLFLLPFLFFLNPAALSIDPTHAIILVIAGVFEMIGVTLYLKALMSDDASTVVPFFQIVPVFSLILGFVLLGEVLTHNQILAGLGVVTGGALLSLEFSEERKLKFKLSLVFLMILSSFFFALFDALFKYGVIESTFWTGVFWQHVGICLVGVSIFFFKKGCGAGFINNIQKRGPGIFGLNMLNESFYIGGVMLFSAALLLAPIALVAAVNAYNPLFVFIIGFLLTITFPRFIKERITIRHLLHKTLAIGVIVVSSAFLLS